MTSSLRLWWKGSNMNRRDFIRTGIGAYLGTTAALAKTKGSKKSQRPNILWIMLDDGRADAVGCYGKKWAKTPHLDRLAERGVRFATAVVQNPVCVPSRKSMKTGHYCSTFGITAMGKPPAVPGRYMDSARPNLPNLLNAWKQIGIDVRTDLLEWSVFIQERVDKADFDALILGWQMGIEPDLYQIWHSSQTNPYQLNFVGFKNKQADDLIIKIRQEYDHRKQVEYSHQLHKIIAREKPYTFLYVSKWTALLDKRVIIKATDPNGKAIYKKIKPTQTGNYAFHFNKWIKLSTMPPLAVDG